MLRHLLPLILGAALLVTPAFASSRSSSGSSTHHRSSTSSRVKSSVPRAKNGRIKRSATAKHDFERSTPCPATGRTSGPCKGYVIDHIQPLACGGADQPSNMQWQTTAEGKAKDARERKGCR